MRVGECSYVESLIFVFYSQHSQQQLCCIAFSMYILGVTKSGASLKCKLSRNSLIDDLSSYLSTSVDLLWRCRWIVLCDSGGWVS